MTVVTAKLVVRVAEGSPITPVATIRPASHLEDEQGAWTRNGGADGYGPVHRGVPPEHRGP
jgi:hypothetical protein